LAEPTLNWFPLEDAFEESWPNLFSLLHWDFRLVETLYGREGELKAILAWARTDTHRPLARLITGQGGVGKTRLAATAAEILKHEGWLAGFLDSASDFVVRGESLKGLFLILDYPEEQPERTKALLGRLAELVTAPYPIRIVFLSRRSFAEWEPETALLKGRFGRQEIAAPGPLSISDGKALIAEAARNFTKRMEMALPGLQGAEDWLNLSPLHRLPLYAAAAAIHAVLSPTQAFGLAGDELVGQIALRERARARMMSPALGFGEKGLERLLALGVLADGLSAKAIRELYGAGLCEPSAKNDFVEALARTSWWKAGRLVRLEPDPLAAKFLQGALFGANSLAEPARLADWLYLALREKASAFGARLGRILYDLDVLNPDNEAARELDKHLVEMLNDEPSRAVSFAGVASTEVPFWSAEFAAQVALILARGAEDSETKAAFYNNAANYLSQLGRREQALTAAQEAAELYRALARARPEAFTPNLAMSLNNLANRLSELGRREQALTAAQEAVDLRRALARTRPEAFTPDLAGSLNNLAATLSELGRREEALTAAQEAADLYRALALTLPEAFTPYLATALNTLAAALSELGRGEEALAIHEEIKRLLGKNIGRG